MSVRFIVLIDMSDYASGLLKTAVSWSKVCSAELLLVHHISPLTPAMLEAADKEELSRIAEMNAEQNLKTWAQAQVGKELAMHYLVVEKDLGEAVNMLLAENYQQLVFLGLKGTGTLKKIFIGSVAVDIINEINNISIAIPKGIEEFSPVKIHVAVQPENPVNLLDFDKFLALTGSLITKIVFFSISNDQEDRHSIARYLAELSERYDGKQSRAAGFELYESRRVFEDIKAIVKPGGQEFLVVQRGGRLFADLVFRKLLINELIYDARIPMVVLP